MLTVISFLLLPFIIFLIYRVLKDPLWGILLVLVLRPIEPLLGLESVQVGRLMGLLTFLIWFIYLSNMKGAFKRLRNSELLKYMIPLFLFLFLGTLSWVSSDGGDLALDGFLNIFLLGLLALMLENVVTSKSRLSILLFVFSLSGAIASLPAAAFMVGFDLYSVLGLEAPTASDDEIELIRAGTVGGGANTLGNLARTGVWTSLILLLIDRRQWVFIVSFLVVSMLGLMLSASRTNFYGILIALIIFLGFIVFYARINLARVTVAFGVFIVMGYFVYSIAPKGTQNRLVNTEGSEYADERLNSRNDFRKNQQDEALELFIRYPLTGSGLYRSRIELNKSLAFHDTFSVVVGETGLFGMITSVLLLLGALYRIYQELRSRKNSVKVKIYFSAFFAVLVSLNVMGFFGGLIFLFDRSFWIFLGVTYAALNLNRAELL